MVKMSMKTMEEISIDYYEKKINKYKKTATEAIMGGHYSAAMTFLCDIMTADAIVRELEYQLDLERAGKRAVEAANAAAKSAEGE